MLHTGWAFTSDALGISDGTGGKSKKSRKRTIR